MDDLERDFHEMMVLYNDIKREIKRRDRRLYDQWHAGGCMIDSEFVSMYPFLEDVVEQLAIPHCEKCGEELDRDCQGAMRCPDCDGPCLHCYDGGMEG